MGAQTLQPARTILRSALERSPFLSNQVLMSTSSPRPLRPAVRDGLLDSELFERLHRVLSWVPLYFLNRTERDPSAHPLDMYWYYPLAMVDDRYTDDAEPALAELDDNLSVVRDIWQAVRDAVGFPVRLYECEYTANGYGNEGHPHHDSPRSDLRAGHIAAIVYCNPEWKIEWAGETVIFDEDTEVAAAVLPKPGRITFIHSDPLHVARGVSRICPWPRRVLVYKMWRTDIESAAFHTD